MKSADTHDANKVQAFRNRLSGIVLMLIGVFVMVEASGYEFGTAARMGPGFLPMTLGGLTVVTGLLTAVITERVDESAIQVVSWNAALPVLGAILTFGLLIDTVGLAAATAALVFICGLADRELNFRSLFVLYLILLAIVHVVFGLILGIPFELVKMPF